MKLQNAIYGVWCVSKVRVESVRSKKRIEITSGAQERKDSAVHLHGLSVLVLQG